MLQHVSRRTLFRLFRQPLTLSFRRYSKSTRKLQKKYINQTIKHKMWSRPHSNRVSSNRVRQLCQSVCRGETLSLGCLGKPELRSGGAVYVSNRVRHSNQARRALGSRRPHSNRVSSNRVRQLSQSVYCGVTLSLGWLGKKSHAAANCVRVPAMPWLYTVEKSQTSRNKYFVFPV